MKTAEFYHVMQKYLAEGQFLPTCSRRLRSDVRRACDKFTIKGGRLYYVGPNRTYMRLVVMSEDEKKFALNECHENIETGTHHGMRGTRNRVISSYYWPALIRDVTEWVKSCERCQSNFGKTGMPALNAVKKSVPVKVLVAPDAVAEEVCHSVDLCPVEERSRIPIVTAIEGSTASEEIKPHFRVVVGSIPTLLDPPLAQQLLGKSSNEQSTQTSHTPHTRFTTAEKEADVNYIYKRYLLQELEVRKADLQYTKLKIRKLELEIKKMEKEVSSQIKIADVDVLCGASAVNDAAKMADKNTRIAIVNHDKLPIPRPGEVLGLVGTNGIGKSTALKILAGKQKPNLGKYDAPPDWQEILAYFRGSELQNYFTKILEDDLKAIVKPQYVDQIPKTVKGSVGAILSRKDDTKTEEIVCEQLDLLHLRDRNVEDLSGGELQRFACAVVCIQRADIFMFDEPSSYLDVKQRLRAAITIRSLISPDRYIIVVEHDLSVLDYLSDFICCLYGVPSAYGVVTMPFSVREGINIFLDGYVPTENLRFRETSLVFKVAETAAEEEVKKMCRYQYPNMCKSMGDFSLTITEGEFTDSEIMGSVRALLHDKIRDAYTHPQFVTDVMKPMQIESIIDQDVQNLSGGELQRVALALCLGKPADVYLIDEPSAYLDSEQRLMAARVIKRFILHAKKTAFVVEHDFIMATYLADRVIVFDGVPSKNTCANT
ncbi:ATP-binding cassette sub-family E member 1 [Bagarius yarrelli]|uniref:ATP-binding cassette sub-family E member 1 n=1 Tax=Bagarius yarrelli TaxID=175774 RepID=A0A556U042_BAGYA|nr:ATP-binding cassette sub-family E member 1 [Bagarius yarrelli]